MKNLLYLCFHLTRSAVMKKDDMGPMIHIFDFPFNWGNSHSPIIILLSYPGIILTYIKLLEDWGKVFIQQKLS